MSSTDTCRYVQHCSHDADDGDDSFHNFDVATFVVGVNAADDFAV